MKHILLFKLHPQTDRDWFYALLLAAYHTMEQELDFLSNAHVYCNQWETPTNYDMMVSFTIQDLSRLPDYINCPTHLAAQAATRDAVASVVKFDYQPPIN